MASGIMGRFYRQEPENREHPEAAELSLLGAAQAMPAQPASDSAATSDEEASLGPDMVSERVNLHRYLLDRINLGILDTLDNEEIATEIRPLVKDYIRTNNFPLNAKEINDLIRDITDEMLGLRTDRAAAGRRHDRRYSHQRLQQRLCRAQRQARAPPSVSRMRTISFG